MRKILALLLIGLNASIIVKAQDINAVNIIINYNTIRNEITNSDVDLYEDTLISNVLSNENYLDYLQNQFSNDSLRAILQENGIYDFQIEFMKLEYDRDKVFDNAFIKENQYDLINILKDTNFNRIGIFIELKDNTLSTYLIFTKRFIEFDLIKYGRIITDLDGNIVKHTIQVSGRSYVKNIRYSSVPRFENNINGLEKLQVSLQLDNSFEIIIDKSPHTEASNDKYLIFTNDRDEIISIHKL